MRDTGVIETSEIFFLFSHSWSTIIIIILTVSVFFATINIFLSHQFNDGPPGKCGFYLTLKDNNAYIQIYILY